MKIIILFINLLHIVALANAKETIYTGSTPAGNTVRHFLDIPLSDSIDFIRWKLTITGNQFRLYCNYGIGKPNTNGFMEGGKMIDLQGTIIKQPPYYRLSRANNTLSMVELNGGLFHILDASGQLLSGNGGWSYTLNNLTAVPPGQLIIRAATTILQDSMIFEGRTPCRVPGIVPAGKTCYKLKWLFVFYADAQTHQPTTYTLNATAYRRDGSKKGKWTIVKDKDGNIAWHLYDDEGRSFIFLQQASDNVLLFSDEKGNLLVGDEDFSYTLNRRMRSE